MLVVKFELIPLKVTILRVAQVLTPKRYHSETDRNCNPKRCLDGQKDSFWCFILTDILNFSDTKVHEGLRPSKKNRCMHSLNVLFYASHFCQQRGELYEHVRSVCVLAVI